MKAFTKGLPWSSWSALAPALMLVALSTGCRSVGSMLGSKDAEARSGTVWNVPAPDIPPPLYRLEQLYLPGVEDILAACETVLDYA